MMQSAFSEQSGKRSSIHVYTGHYYRKPLEYPLEVVERGRVLTLPLFGHSGAGFAGSNSPLVHRKLTFWDESSAVIYVIAKRARTRRTNVVRLLQLLSDYPQASDGLRDLRCIPRFP